MLVSKLLQIRSSDKILSTQTGSDFTVHTDQGNTMIHHIWRAELVSAIVPNTMFNVNSTNKTFNYTITGTATTYSLGEGQYTTTEVISALNTQMTGVTLVQDSTTQKITVSTDGSTTLVASGQDLMTYLGFHEDIDIAIGSSQTASGMPDFSGLDMIYVSSNLGNNNCISSQGHSNDIIASIPVDVSFGYSQLYSSNHSGEDSSINYTSHSQDCSTVSIKLLDKNMNELELNGAETSFMFRVFYRHGVF